MNFVRTVLGDVAPGDLGVCYAHEHIIIDPSYTTYKNPDFQIDSVEKACEELTRFRAAGGRAMVDSLPGGAGRNVLKLAEVSRRTGVHIVCPTGYHLRKYYPPGHWGERATAERMARLFVDEIELGADANDCNGPWLERTPHRAGVIKVAGGLRGIDDFERKCFEAAAQAHRETGAPILTHSEQGAAALEQTELFRSLEVNLSSVIISHTDRKPDAAYHREILSTGVFLEYDSGFRRPEAKGNPTLEMIVAMVDAGFGSQLLLGMDAARRRYWRSYGGRPGLSFLLDTFRPRLAAAGVPGETINGIFVANPARAYRFQGR